MWQTQCHKPSPKSPINGWHKQSPNGPNGRFIGLPHNAPMFTCACGGEAATDHIAHLVHDLRTTPQGKPRYEWISMGYQWIVIDMGYAIIGYYQL